MADTDNPTDTTDTTDTAEATDTDDPTERSTRRNAWAFSLVVIASVIALLATVSTWLERQALDTDAWVEATDQLLADDDVRESLAIYLVDELYSSVEVGEEISSLLPSDFERLGPIVAGALREPAVQAVDRVLATEAVRTTWREANRLAHETLIAIIEDDTGEVLSTAGGVVSIDLGALVRAVGERIGLGDAILDRLPEGAGVVVLFESDELGVVQDAAQAVKRLTAFLFVLVVALYATAVYLSTDRRRAIRGVGLGLTIVGLLVLLARVVGVDVLVSNLARADDDEPAQSILDIGSTLLRQLALTEVLIGLALLTFAFLRGSSKLAGTLRLGISPALRHGVVSAVLGGILVFVFLLWVKPGGPIDGWMLAIGGAALCVAGVAWVQQATVAEHPDMTWGRVGELAMARARRDTGRDG